MPIYVCALQQKSHTYGSRTGTTGHKQAEPKIKKNKKTL